MNGNVTPIRPNWGDTAKPFMHDLVIGLQNDITMEELTERLARVGKTPKDFLIDSCLNVLTAITNNNWAVGMFNDKIRARAMERADALADAFGGYDQAVMGLVKQDLAAVEAGLR